MREEEEDIPGDPSTLIRIGVVIEVTLSPPRCRVRYGDPDGDDAETETPEIRWLSGRAGKTRKWSPPSVGEEVVLLSPDGQIGNAVALTGLVNDQNPAPSVQDLELWQFEDGAKISYDPAAHALVALLPADSTARLEAKTITLVGDVTIEGKMHVTEDAQFDAKLTATGKITSNDDVVAGNISLKTHRTSGVTAGGGISQAPVP
jgi:phage baseplate assembly protein V